jgi:hypothetical protein
MQIHDAQGRIIRTPEVTQHLHRLVLADPVIASLAEAIEPDPQIWGSSGMHFAARLVGSGEPALLKLNVPHDQRWWSAALGGAQPDLIPRIAGVGERVGDAPIGWLLSERVRNGLHPGWEGREFDMLLEAAIRFQIAARGLAARARAAGAVSELRLDDLAAAIDRGVRSGAPGPADIVQARLTEHWAWVERICEPEICHGDLHLANALCREEPPRGQALLIDYHPTRMPWAYEAAKPEILNAEPGRPGCRGLVAREALHRSWIGMSAPVGADLARLQAIVLGWWAIQLWAYIGPSPDPAWRDPRVWRAENQAFIEHAAAA